MRLLDVAHAARDMLRERSGSHPLFDWDPDTLCGACGHGAWLLSNLVPRFCGIPARPVTGVFREQGHWMTHCWTVLGNGMLLDVTATQFRDAPPGQVLLLDIRGAHRMYRAQNDPPRLTRRLFAAWYERTPEPHSSMLRELTSRLSVRRVTGSRTPAHTALL